jgi:hypothetical protein
VYVIQRAVVIRTNEDGSFDTNLDDFNISAPDPATALAIANTYITNQFPSQIEVRFAGGATLVAANVIAAP